MAKVRNDLFKPAAEYYESFANANAENKDARPYVADAYYHLAGIHAKQGLNTATALLTDGLRYINMMKVDNADASTYPSSYHSALQYTLPTEWFSLRNSRGELAASVLGYAVAADTYTELSAKYPDTPIFPGDLAAVVRIPATLFGFAGANDRAVAEWRKAVDALDRAVQKDPANADYQTRLAEALSAMASRQKSAGKLEESLPSFERAVKLREGLAAAAPEDATRKSQLNVAKRDLDRAQKDLAKKQGTPAKPDAAGAAEETAAKPTSEAPKEAPAGETKAEGDTPPAEPPATTP
jgi:tetratricopeptide (TPR) repeat protein